MMPCVLDVTRAALAEIFDRHERVFLAFSGGKDSFALAHMCDPWRDRTTRVEAFRFGLLFFDEFPKMAECIVWNVSGLGALIEVHSGVEVPERFRLLATALRLDRNCRVAWRDDRKIGIEFATE